MTSSGNPFATINSLAVHARIDHPRGCPRLTCSAHRTVHEVTIHWLRYAHCSSQSCCMQSRTYAVIQPVSTAYDGLVLTCSRLLQLPGPDLDDLRRAVWNVSSSELNKAYRKLSLLVHPDKMPGPEARQAFERLKEAYNVLKDTDKLVGANPQPHLHSLNPVFSTAPCKHYFIYETHRMKIAEAVVLGM